MEGGSSSNANRDNDQPLSWRGQRVLAAMRQTWNRKRQPAFPPLPAHEPYVENHSTNSYRKQVVVTTPKTSYHQSDRPSLIGQPDAFFGGRQPEYPLDRIEEETCTDHPSTTFLDQLSKKSAHVPLFRFSTVQQNTGKLKANDDRQNNIPDKVTSNFSLQKVRELESTQSTQDNRPIFASSYRYDQDRMSREKVSKYIRENFNKKVLPKVSATQMSLDLFGCDDEDDEESPMDLSPPQSVPLGSATLNNVRWGGQNVPDNPRSSTHERQASSIIGKDLTCHLNPGMRRTNTSFLAHQKNDVSKENSDDFLNDSLMECEYSQESTKPRQKETNVELMCRGKMNEEMRKIHPCLNKNSEFKEREEVSHFQKTSARIFNVETGNRTEPLKTIEVATETNYDKDRRSFMQYCGSLQKAQNSFVNYDENVLERTDKSRREQMSTININMDKKVKPSMSYSLESCNAPDEADENDQSLTPETESYVNSVIPHFDLAISSIDDLFDELEDSQELTTFVKDNDQAQRSGEEVRTTDRIGLQAVSSEDLFFSQLMDSESSLPDFMKDVEQGDITGEDVCTIPDLQANIFSSEDLFSSDIEMKPSEGSLTDFMKLTDQAPKCGKAGRTQQTDFQARSSQDLFCDKEMQHSEGSLADFMKDTADQARRDEKEVIATHTELEARSGEEDLFASDIDWKNSEFSLADFIEDTDQAHRSGKGVSTVHNDLQTHPIYEDLSFNESVLEDTEFTTSEKRYRTEAVTTDLRTNSIHHSEIKELTVVKVTTLADTNDKKHSEVDLETNSTKIYSEYFVQSEKENIKSNWMDLKPAGGKKSSNPSKSPRSPEDLRHNTFELQDNSRVQLSVQRPLKKWLPPNRASEETCDSVSSKSKKQNTSFKNTFNTTKEECVKNLLLSKCTSHDPMASDTIKSKKQSRKRSTPTGAKTSEKSVAHKKQNEDGSQIDKPLTKQTKIPFKITKKPPSEVKSSKITPQAKTSGEIDLEQCKGTVDMTMGEISKTNNAAKPQGPTHKGNDGGAKPIKENVPLKATIPKSPIIGRKLIIPDMFQKNKTKASCSNLDKPTSSNLCAKRTTFKVPYKRQDIQGIEDNITQEGDSLPIQRMSIVQINNQTCPLIEKKISTCTLKEIGLTIVYREGFCQLNLPEDKARSADRCTATGIMLAITSTINTTYCYLDANMERWKNAALPKLFLSSLLTATCKKICYDAQAMAAFLVDVFGFDQKEVCAGMEMVIDPLVGCWLLDPDHPPNRFHDALDLMGIKQPPRRMEDKHSSVCQSLQLLSELAVGLQEKLEERHLWRLFTDVEMKLVPVLAVMELRGLRVNKKKFQEISGILEKRIVFLQENAYKAAGKKFQLNSTLQLRQILYEDLKLDVKHSIVIKETLTMGAKSTSEPMLRLLEKLHPLPGIVLEYRHLQKLRSTYVDAMLQHIREDTIFTTWEQTAAATGRISSSNPNLQAVPKQLVSSSTADHSKQGPQFEPLSLRAPYIPRDGCSFLSADFQHVELRLFAYLSQDTALLSELQHPGDIFMQLANSWLGKSGHVIGPDDREKTKRIVYSIMYGAGPGKLSEFLEVSGEEANKIINSFVAMFPALRAYPRRLINQCRRQGYLCSISGRRRMFPNISSPNPGLRTHSERQAINFVIQGSAADICKSAMLHTEQQLSARPELDVRLLLQIHDELVWDVPNKHLLQATELVREGMMASTSLYGLDVKLGIPLPVTMATGCHWGDMKQLLPGI